MMKKRNLLAIFTVIILLLIIGKVNEDIKVSTKRSQGQNHEISDLAFDNLDLDTYPGIGFELVFENDNHIIFYGKFGLFCYDFLEDEIIFEIDFLKVFGEEGSVEGQYGTLVDVSEDGKNITITYTTPNETYEAYYLNAETLTYWRDCYKPMENIFSPGDAIGYVRPGSTIGHTVYVRNEQEYEIFRNYIKR